MRREKDRRRERRQSWETNKVEGLGEKWSGYDQGIAYKYMKYSKNEYVFKERRPSQCRTKPTCKDMGSKCNSKV